MERSKLDGALLGYREVYPPIPVTLASCRLCGHVPAISLVGKVPGAKHRACEGTFVCAMGGKAGFSSNTCATGRWPCASRSSVSTSIRMGRTLSHGIKWVLDSFRLLSEEAQIGRGCSLRSAWDWIPPLSEACGPPLAAPTAEGAAEAGSSVALSPGALHRGVYVTIVCLGAVTFLP